MNLSFYHNTGKIYLSLLFILINSFLIQAQNISNNLWIDLNLNYEMFNTIDLKYEIGNRSNDNGARKSYHDFIIKYSVNKRFKIALGTRNSNLSFLDSTIFNDGLKEDFEDVADRFHFDVSGRLIKYGEFKLKYRIRAQRKNRGFYSGIGNPTFKRTYIRSRGVIEYTVSKKMRATAGSELFFSLEENSPIYIGKNRHTLGVEYDLNKIYSARLKYSYQTEFRPSLQESLNILMLNFKIDLNQLSKKLNLKN